MKLSDYGPFFAALTLNVGTIFFLCLNSVSLCLVAHDVMYT